MKKEKIYISEQYIEEFMDTVGAVVGDTITRSASSAAAAAGATAVSAGIGMLFQIGPAISEIKKKLEWKKLGCNHVLDPNEKNRCQSLSIDNLAREIQKLSSSCNKSKDPMGCRNTINNELAKLREQKNNLMNRAVGPTE